MGRWTPTQRRLRDDRIRELRAAGWSIRAIQKDVFCSSSTVFKALQRTGDANELRIGDYDREQYLIKRGVMP